MQPKVLNRKICENTSFSRTSWFRMDFAMLKVLRLRPLVLLISYINVSVNMQYFGNMTMENQTTIRKTTPVSRCSTQETVPVLLCLLLISHGLPRNRIRAFALRAWRLRNKLQFLPHNKTQAPSRPVSWCHLGTQSLSSENYTKRTNTLSGKNTGATHSNNCALKC